MAAYAHIVCAVIGSGVLSLAWSMSWLGRLRTYPGSFYHEEGLHAIEWAACSPMRVLSLVWHAGWAAGVIVIFLFAWITQ